MKPESKPEGATARPWEVIKLQNPNASEIRVVAPSDHSYFPHPAVIVKGHEHEKRAALIVRAVNSLAAYEELERVVTCLTADLIGEDYEDAPDDVDCVLEAKSRYRDVRSALAALAKMKEPKL